MSNLYGVSPLGKKEDFWFSPSGFRWRSGYSGLALLGALSFGFGDLGLKGVSA